MHTQGRDCLTRLFAGEAFEIPPIWLMRQAGRYLPEYREVRATAGSFLDLCYNPSLAAEVTLQPIRRFDFDAAILFSDILVVPDSLGQDVTFVEGEGPRLDPIATPDAIETLDPNGTEPTLDPIFETVRKVRAELSAEKSLIGFCGAPWTVATYMIAGQGSVDQAPARLFAYKHPGAFADLIDILVDTSVSYLSGQVEAGANVVQLFDSWAGSLPEPEFNTWVVEPTRKIVKRLKGRFPNLPVIGFPRGAQSLAKSYADQTGIDGIGCDTGLSLEAMFGSLAENHVVQGNLDPLLLASGGDGLEERIAQLVQAARGKRYIFNLGHGIVPKTPPEHVARLVEAVRNAK